MPVQVADRKIYVTTQGTQTVKVCTPRNIRGEYERYFRVYPPTVLQHGEMEESIQRFASLDDLERWLIEDRRARREPENESLSVYQSHSSLLPTNPVGSPLPTTFDEEPSIFPEVVDDAADLFDLMSPQAYAPQDDEWLRDARGLVESAINELVQEFSDFPHLHRVEHSIHAALYQRLKATPELAGSYRLGQTKCFTQLVHKEWPETTPRREKGNRRGNFDIVVLTPQLLASCVGVDIFLDGRLPAPIVIELGLDYDHQHLASDAKKLLNSKPQFGYLIHLVRDTRRDPLVEEIILALEASTTIKVAYARVADGKQARKLLNETNIATN